MKRIINIFLILIILLAVSCHKEKTVDCKISTPHTGQEFFTDENIKVSVEVDDSKCTIKSVHLYIDNKCYRGTSNFPYEFTIKAGDILPGDRVLKIVAQNMDGIKRETEIAIKVIEPLYESPDFVSFSDGLIPIGWKTLGWFINPKKGYLDSFSIFTRADNSYVTTSKTWNYLEFYLMGLGYVNFYIDGALIERFYIHGDWGLPQLWRKYSYDFPDGFHTFIWEFYATGYSNSCAGLDAISFIADEEN
jgi:hypothetical protein